MRFVVISKATNFQALQKALAAGTQPAATTAAMLERVKTLNPHVDLQRLAAGSVLLLPDLPSLNPAQSRSIGGEAFADLAAEVMSGLKAAAERARVGADAAAADRRDVTAAQRIAAVKRIIESDTTLAQQLQAAAEHSTAEQKQAQQAAEAAQTLATHAAAELAALQKLFG